VAPDGSPLADKVGLPVNVVGFSVSTAGTLPVNIVKVNGVEFPSPTYPAQGRVGIPVDIVEVDGWGFSRAYGSLPVKVQP
jgi:hypothetical protein